MVFPRLFKSKWVSIHLKYREEKHFYFYYFPCLLFSAFLWCLIRNTKENKGKWF